MRGVPSLAEGTRRSHPSPPRRPGLLSTAGELLITAGVLLILFVCWQLWWTGVQAAAVQNTAAEQFVRQIGPSLQAVPENPSEGYGPAEVSEAPGPGETFGIIYIPRFGPGYSRPLTEGTGTEVLDTLGLGHYPSSAMPGALGNFALAGHRQTHGAVLDALHTLVPGDRIYVQTKDGFYTYIFRNQQIVLPERADVLLPVPTEPGFTPEESLLTMTSCNPRFGAQERIIAYSVLESWRPLSAGAPKAIAAQVAALHGEG
ncbi:class E sortase [Arthrobacter frigidicola]|nr:class E sortase [Arthrobacter frigidicola]